MSESANDLLGAGGKRSDGIRAPVRREEPEQHDQRAQPETRARLAECALTLRQAAARPEPEYRSVYKAGGMPFGFYGVEHGPGGFGKTRELLRASVLRTLGKRWHCWEPTEEPFRPLVLSLEIGRAPVTKWLEMIPRDIGGKEAWEAVADQVRVIGFPEYVESLHAGPAATEELLEAIERHGSNYVLIDSLSEIKGGSGGDTPEDYAPAIEMLKFVSRATNAHLQVIHHNRRLPAGSKITDAPADQIRGPAALVDASRWASAMDAYHGKKRITWHKVSFGPRPADCYFKIDDMGIPRDDIGPDEGSSTGAVNRSKVLAAIPEVGGITRQALQAAVGLSESAVGDHLRRLCDERVVVKLPSGRQPAYCLASSQPPELMLPGSMS